MDYVRAAVNDRHVRPERTHAPELADVGRRPGENVDAVAVAAPGIGEPDAPVTRRRGDQALIAAFKPTDEVVGAAALEASDRADVLHLDDGLTPERLGEHRVGELWCVQERRIDHLRRFLDSLEREVHGWKL